MYLSPCLVYLIKTVAIDIDGVIYNIIDHIIDRFLPNIEKGYQPKNWECCNELGITKSEFYDYYYKCWKQTTYDAITAIKYTNDDIMNLLTELRKKNYRISIITKRPVKNMINTIHYLNLMRISYDSFTNIIDDQDKTKENFDVLIDDYHGNMPQGINGKFGILLTKEWNKSYTGECIRVNSLSEVPNILETLFSLNTNIQI